MSIGGFRTTVAGSGVEICPIAEKGLSVGMTNVRSASTGSVGEDGLNGVGLSHFVGEMA
jgi:hypothetical protein